MKSEIHAAKENLSLNDAANLLLEECRTISPGIQALFGFQLIATFSPGFDEKLTSTDQYLHLGAIVMVAVAYRVDHDSCCLPPANRPDKGGIGIYYCGEPRRVVGHGRA